MVCFQALVGEQLVCAAVNACWLGVEVQIHSVRHEPEHDASEDVTTALLLAATVGSLVIVRRVMGEVFFVHCCEVRVCLACKHSWEIDGFGQACCMQL